MRPALPLTKRAPGALPPLPRPSLRGRRGPRSAHRGWVVGGGRRPRRPVTPRDATEPPGPPGPSRCAVGFAEPWPAGGTGGMAAPCPTDEDDDLDPLRARPRTPSCRGPPAREHGCSPALLPVKAAFVTAPSPRPSLRGTCPQPVAVLPPSSAGRLITHPAVTEETGVTQGVCAAVSPEVRAARGAPLKALGTTAARCLLQRPPRGA